MTAGATEARIARIARGIRAAALALPAIDALAIGFYLAGTDEPLLVAGGPAALGLAARIATVVLLLRAVRDLEATAADRAARQAAVARVRTWAIVSVVLLLVVRAASFILGLAAPPGG